MNDANAWGSWAEWYMWTQGLEHMCDVYKDVVEGRWVL